MIHMTTTNRIMDWNVRSSCPFAQSVKVVAALNRIMAVRRERYRCIQFIGNPVEDTVEAPEIAALPWASLALVQRGPETHLRQRPQLGPRSSSLRKPPAPLGITQGISKSVGKQVPSMGFIQELLRTIGGSCRMIHRIRLRKPSHRP